MITRIDIIQVDDNFQIRNKEDIPKNWLVEIKEKKLFVVGLSNANPERERVSEFSLKEGSLFLFNSSRDFYCYFRNKEIQDIFDEFNIIKMTSITDRVYVTLHVENGKVTNPITRINGFNIKERVKSSFKIVDGDKEYFQVLFIFEPSKNVSEIPFILQKGINNDNETLYLLKNKTVKEFYEKVKEVPELYSNNELILEE